MMPFTRQQFLAVIVAYNEAYGPCKSSRGSCAGPELKGERFTSTVLNRVRRGVRSRTCPRLLRSLPSRC